MAEQLRAQIDSGAYAFRKFPTEKELSEEFGVSYMTARSAVQQLISEKILFRKRNCPITVAGGAGKQSALRVAMLIPSFSSPYFSQWRQIVNDTVRDMDGVVVRPVHYMGFDDPVLWNALNGFDGSFLIVSSEAIPPEMLERLRGLPRPPVVLGYDYGGEGLPSLLPYPPTCVPALLDHLAERGHERIACFNVQVNDEEIIRYIGQWQVWMAAHGFKAPLVNEPIGPGEQPFEASIPKFARHYPARRGEFTAVFCVTLPAAFGVYRVLHDQAEKPGGALAVTTLNLEGIGDSLSPALTAIASPELKPFVRIGLDWMRGRAPWEGPLSMRSETPTVMVRESSARSWPDG